MTRKAQSKEYPYEPIILYHSKNQKARKNTSGVTTMTIKEARQQVGLTQRALSEWLDIPKRTIENWEQNKCQCPEWCEKLLVEKILTYKN